MAQKKHARRFIPDCSGDLEDFYDYARVMMPRRGRSLLGVEELVTVRDNWPEVLPITDAELRVMESHFAKELDDILGPRA